jgi:hypothetical protein
MDMGKDMIRASMNASRKIANQARGDPKEYQKGEFKELAGFRLNIRIVKVGEFILLMKKKSKAPEIPPLPFFLFKSLKIWFLYGFL